MISRGVDGVELPELRGQMMDLPEARTPSTPPTRLRAWKCVTSATAASLIPIVGAEPGRGRGGGTLPMGIQMALDPP